MSATATFSPANRIPEMPTSTAPQHQFSMPAGSLSVRIDYGYHWDTGALTYHYGLDAEMGSGDPASQTRVMLGFGVQQGATCQLEESTTDHLSRYLPDILLYDNKDTPDLASAANWNCAVLAVENAETGQLYDAFVTALDVVTATPQLRIKAPRKDRLVTGVWTRIPVTVTNLAAEGIGARDAVITGSGRGVKVRRATIGSLDGQDDTEVDVWVKLRTPKAKVRFAVREQGQVLGRATVNVRRRSAPAPPRAGRWTSSGVDFTVRGGKVRAFRIVTQTQCGGYPDPITTTQNTYDFPTVRIPRNNEVVASDRGNRHSNAEYVVYLDLEFVSRTKAKGAFRYFGPARCNAIDGITVTHKR